MIAYLAIKYHQNASNRGRIEAITSALEACGFETVCIVRDTERWGAISFSPRDLMIRSFEEIDRSDLIVVDLTEKGVGLGIEAGYAYARSKPIVTIAERGADISTTLRGVSSRVCVYDRISDLETVFAALVDRLAPSSTGDRFTT